MPIEYRNMPSDFEIVGDFPSFVTVRLRGSALILRNLKPQDIKVWVDLRDVKEGKNKIYIKNVKVPEGVKVVKVSPERIVIGFEKIVAKRLGVKVKWRKKPKFRWRVSPPYVEARGRKSILKKMKFVTTEPVDPDVLMADKVIEVRITAPAAITIEPETVRVEVLE